VFRRPRLLAAVPLLALVAGCFGGAANPSYFPHYLPPGDVIATHAKPAGPGYFADFDRHAARVDVSPAQSNASTGTEQVLIATVSDEDGDARRKRRVEWIVDGPGVIIEVDEAGITPGRGWVADNKRAVSYTGHRDHDFDRGTDSPRDDFSVKAGQTWCIISSAVPGETTVTAYAPAVHNADRRRATARITWAAGPATGKLDLPPAPVTAGLSRDEFTPVTPPATAPATPPAVAVSQPKPAPVPNSLTLDARAPRTVALDREFTLTAELSNPGRTTSPAGSVRVAVPAGAEVVRTDPKPAATPPDRVTWDVGPVPAGETRTFIVRVRPVKNGPLVFDATAEADDGAKAEKRATVTVGAGKLAVSARTPPPARPGDRVTVPVTVTNPGTVGVDNATLFVTLPKDGVRHGSGANPAEVAVGTVAAGGSKTVDVPVTADRAGDFKLAFNARGSGDATGKADVQLAVEPEREPDPPIAEPPPPPPPPPGRPALALVWTDLPGTLPAGARRTVTLTLKNRGTGPATAVEVAVTGDGVRPVGGVGADRQRGQVSAGRLTFNPVAEVPAGGYAVFTVELEGVTPGATRVHAEATSPTQALPVREQQNLRVVRE